MRILWRVVTVALCVASLAVMYMFLWPDPPTQRIYKYGIAHGREDAKFGVHRARDVDDAQTAISYLSMPLIKKGKPDPASLQIIKEVFDAPKEEQRRYLESFARGYREGYKAGFER